MSNPTRLRRGVIVDSIPLWLEAIEATLTPLSVEVVHKATDWTDALHALEAHEPELFVAGIELGEPVDDALAALAAAVTRHPGLKVIAMSSKAEAAAIETALAGGAAAVVMKSAHPDDLASAVRQVFDQSVYYAHGRIARETEPPQPASTRPAPSRSGEAHSPFGELTRREVEILGHVAEGRSNAELAKELWVTEQTVKFHLSNIYRKLGVRNRTQASLWAQRNRLVPQRAETSAA
jgi:DNA-binding NarL/FixJ family response regulator